MRFVLFSAVQAMMEQSKRSSLVVARSILNNKLISKKLERYLKVGVQPELNFEAIRGVLRTYRIPGRCYRVCGAGDSFIIS